MDDGRQVIAKAHLATKNNHVYNLWDYVPVYDLWPMLGAFICVIKSANIGWIHFSL